MAEELENRWAPCNKNEMTPDGWLVGDDGAWIQ